MVTVALLNGPELYETTFALWKLGAIPHPVSARLPRRELEAVVALADPVVVLCESLRGVARDDWIHATGTLRSVPTSAHAPPVERTIASPRAGPRPARPHRRQRDRGDHACPAQPRSIVLMGGPVDSYAAATAPAQPEVTQPVARPTESSNAATADAGLSLSSFLLC